MTSRRWSTRQSISGSDSGGSCRRRGHVVDADEPGDEGVPGQGVELGARARQAGELRGCGEGELDSLADRAADTLHLFDVLAFLEVTVGAVVRHQAFEGEGEQRQGVGVGEVVDQLLGELRIDGDAASADVRRAFDDLLERGCGQRRQIEGQSGNARQPGMPLELREAVGADGEQDEQVRVGFDGCGHKLDHPGGLFVPGHEQLLGLIDRQDHGGGLRVAVVRRAEFAQAGDHGRAQLREVPGDARALERALHAKAVLQAGRAGERGAPGAQGRENEEALGVALEPGEQACPEKAGFARARGAEDDQHARGGAVAELADGIQRLRDLGVAPEEDRGVRLLEHAQAAEQRTMRIPGRRPRKGAGVKARPMQPEPKPLMTVDRLVGGRQVGDLVRGRQFDRQGLDGTGCDQDRKDLLAELRREQELGEAPLGCRPVRREQDDYGRTLLARLAQFVAPALSGCQPEAGIEVEKHVAPAFVGEPVAHGLCRGVVTAGVADEDASHGGLSCWFAMPRRADGTACRIRRVFMSRLPFDYARRDGGAES